MEEKMISYCITLKNRADFLEKHIENLLGQSFPAKDIQLCISDGYSDHSPRDVLARRAGQFGEIKFCHSDRATLPFSIPSNSPVCDKNSLVSNVATCEKVVLTDPEVCWTDKESLTSLIGAMKHERNWISVPCLMGSPGQKGWGYVPVYRPDLKGIYSGAGFCLLFDRGMFMKMRGFEERFSQGFACDDVYFCDSWRRELDEIVTSERIFHHWHDDKHLLQKNIDLQEVSLKICRELNCRLPNLDNPNWERPEMIKDLECIL